MSAAVGTGCGKDSGPTTFLVTEAPHVGLVRIPVARRATKIPRGPHPEDLYEFLDARTYDAALGILKGSEGSPIVDADGATIGALRDALGPPSRLFWTIGRAGLDSAWTRAQAFRLKLVLPRLAGNDWRALRSGQHLILTRNLDVNSNAPVVATIVEMRGSEALCGLSEGFSDPSGPCLAAVVHARPVAVASGLQAAERGSMIFEPGELVGAAVWNGTASVLVDLGAAVPTMLCAWKLSRTGVPDRTWQCRLVRDVRGDGVAFSEAFRTFVWTNGSRGMSRAEIITRVGNRIFDRQLVMVAPGTDLFAAGAGIIEEVGKKIAAVDHDTLAIEVSCEE